MAHKGRGRPRKRGRPKGTTNAHKLLAKHFGSLPIKLQKEIMNDPQLKRMVLQALLTAG